MYSDKITSFKKGLSPMVRHYARIMWNKDLDNKTKIESVKQFLNDICDLYEIPEKERPKYIWQDNENQYAMTGGGQVTSDGTIYQFHKFSLVTFLHEVRHYMQLKQKDRIKMVSSNLEDDARAWSMSVFKKACPKSWQRAIDNDLVFFK